MSPRLDLSREGMAEYWKQNDGSGMAAKAIALMEEREDWCGDLESPHVDEAVTSLAVRISRADADELEKVVIDHPDAFIALMGVMRSGRAIILFRWMTIEHTNIAAFLLNLCSLPNDASNDDVSNILKRLMTERLLVLERMCLLSRIFAPTRLAMVLEILEEVKNEIV